MTFDDSVIEYALYDVLNSLAILPGDAIPLHELRSAWRTTALRHSDLPYALQMLSENGNLIEGSSDGGPDWTLTAAGYERVLEIAGVASTTMEDQVARCVLKTLRDRLSPAALAPRAHVVRRRSTAARERSRERLDYRVSV